MSDQTLREALDDLRAWCEMQREAAGLEETEFAAGEFLAYKRVVVHLRSLLAANRPEASALDRAAVDAALRQVIGHADYDLHKSLEGDESGEDTYGEYVDRFIAEYGKAVKS